MKDFKIVNLKQVFCAIFILIIIRETGARTIRSLDEEEKGLSDATKHEIKKCRMECFQKVLETWNMDQDIDSTENVAACRNVPNCYMCHDYCRVLAVAKEDLARAMCSDQIYCMTGCQAACIYHRIKPLKSFLYKANNKS